MKYLKPKIFLEVIFLLNFSLSKGQNSFGSLEGLLNKNTVLVSALKFPKEVKELYLQNQFHNLWTNKSANNNLQILLEFMRGSEEYGLKIEDYQPEVIIKYNSHSKLALNIVDSSIDDIKLSDAAIHFLHDILSGNQYNQLSYNGLNYLPACNDLPGILNSYISNGRLGFLVKELDSDDNAFKSLKSKLKVTLRMIATPDFKDAFIISARVNKLNLPLISRFYQLGFISSDTLTLSEPEIKENLKKTYKLFDTYNNGKLSLSLITAMNVPLRLRTSDLARTMNNIRWLNCIKRGAHVIVVNIPSATLFLYEHGKIVLESNIIVGKGSTPTPTLSSKITDVVIYPYWHVPNRIATHELLPAIKRNPNYLETNNFQLLNKRGVVVNASSVSWQNISAGNFPYEIRQSTGCDNSLGLLKLNFNNPFSVYLHDTPNKNLFSSHKRYFSHGCMRLQKAIELAHCIVKGNTYVMDSLIAKGCLKMQSPLTIKASEIIPVFILYYTAWFNASNEVIFHEDIYHKFIN